MRPSETSFWSDFLKRTTLMDSAVFNFQFLGVGGLKVLKKLPLLQWGSKFCLILSTFVLDAGGGL